MHTLKINICGQFCSREERVARQTQVWSKQNQSRASFASAEDLTEPQEDELKSLKFGIKQVIHLRNLVT